MFFCHYHLFFFLKGFMSLACALFLDTLVFFYNLYCNIMFSFGISIEQHKCLQLCSFRFSLRFLPEILIITQTTVMFWIVMTDLNM